MEADDSGAGADLMASGGAEARTKVSAFLGDYAGLFGLRDARELVSWDATRPTPTAGGTSATTSSIAACPSSRRPSGRTSTPRAV